MRYLKYVVMTTLAAATMLAQSQNKPASNQVEKADPGAAQADKTNKPADQADRPAGQAAPARQPQTGGAAETRSFTGTIVNATCSQASALTNRLSFADRGSSAPSPTATTEQSSSASKSTSSSSGNKDYKSVYDMQRDVMRHCPANAGVTSFAVLTDDGSFYKLDDAGNNQVKSQAGGDSDKHKKQLKNMRVTVTGTVEGDTLKVQSLAKTDKPFGGA